MLHLGQAITDLTDLLLWIGRIGIKKRQKWFIHRTSSNICVQPHSGQYFSRIIPPSTLTLRALVPNTTNIRDYLDCIHVAEKTRGLAHFLVNITKNVDFQMLGLIAESKNRGGYSFVLVSG